MIAKSSFGRFSLPDTEGNYFLRPDRILGAFIVDISAQQRDQTLSLDLNAQIESERHHDTKASRNFVKYDNYKAANTNRIDTFYESINEEVDVEEASSPHNNNAKDNKPDQNGSTSRRKSLFSSATSSSKVAPMPQQPDMPPSLSEQPPLSTTTTTMMKLKKSQPVLAPIPSGTSSLKQALPELELKGLSQPPQTTSLATPLTSSASPTTTTTAPSIPSPFTTSLVGSAEVKPYQPTRLPRAPINQTKTKIQQGRNWEF
jgi:hypothetical protein